MGFDKERRCGIKGRGIHRREANQSNPSNLRGIQNYVRLDHGLARTARTTKHGRTIATAADAVGDRKRRFRFGRIKAERDRLSDFIARIYDERTPRINKRISKRVSNRRVNKRTNKDVGKTK